jgi:hypothetical protein
MPVTRDLSTAKRQAILSWLNDPKEGTPRPHRAPSVLSAAEAAGDAAAPNVLAGREK